jgi:subtilisin
MSDPIYTLPPLERDPVTFSTLTEAPKNWGMDACFVDALRAVAVGGDGEGITVAVLDTGIDDKHPEVSGRISASRSFINGEAVYDGNGHGTHCAGTVLGASLTIGVANKAKLIVGKVLSNGGSGASSGINAGIRWAADQGANVISMSLGGGGADPNQEAAIRAAEAAGVIVLAASGNSRPSRTEYPGRYCLAVAACDINGRVASFSSPGQTPDTLALCTPGVGIISARPGGGYQSMSGTSMATPFAAGIVACVLSVFKKRGQKLPDSAWFKKFFRDWCIDTGVAGPDVDYGNGLVSCKALARYFDTPTMGM